MEALSYIVLVLLSLLGYSGGAVGRAGKRRELKPVIADLVLVGLIWTAAITSRLAFDFNKWLLILAWIGIAAFMGMMAVSIRQLPASEEVPEDRLENLSPGVLKKLWKRWTGFSKRMGSFQSRILLSFFFFVLISPVAFFIMTLGDPLRIKKKKTEKTYWSPKVQNPVEIEDFRRQF